MITDYRGYVEYLSEDKRVNHIVDSKKNIILITWKYLKCMRKLEYYVNCKKGLLSEIRIMLLKYHLYKLSVKSGITIPINTFGKGLYIAHHGSIVVNETARFGDYCVIQNGVNISSGVIGGNHIYLGAGAKAMMDVKIPDNVIIGANAVVTKSISEDNIVVAGIPARKISSNGFKDRKFI